MSKQFFQRLEHIQPLKIMLLSCRHSPKAMPVMEQRPQRPKDNALALSSAGESLRDLGSKFFTTFSGSARYGQCNKTGATALTVTSACHLSGIGFSQTDQARLAGTVVGLAGIPHLTND